MPPIILITPGEPAGIGPDIVLALAEQHINARVLCIADPFLLHSRAALLHKEINIHTVDDASLTPVHQPGNLAVFPVTLKKPVTPGKLDKANAAYVLQCLDVAVSLIQQEQAHAMVTGPVHKGIINEAGNAFTGHTEYLAARTGGTPVMMLASEPSHGQPLRVALATTHLPISQISAAITPALLEQVIRILNSDLQNKFGISKPRILVCGLNPHAGEDGHLGREEIDIIEPTLNRLRDEHIQLTGPLPADTLFTAKYLDQADAVLAMYHDQGLPVLKYSSFGKAINITLGLPVIRTSVDHGTALDLAGTGKADAGSLRVAVDLAIELALKSST
ncbi:MAG: 4-hydroxythreonine-4-phosphate dehydrogenase PdxA [Gammaproteobacteria bacterium]|nr:4-hydroxythreonine-4-phosphate dehydrogenase PdxA [Gammaproteobacteria bacterium]